MFIPFVLTRTKQSEDNSLSNPHVHVQDQNKDFLLPRVMSRVRVLGKEWFYSGVQVYFALCYKSCFSAYCMFHPLAFHVILTSCLSLCVHMSVFFLFPVFQVLFNGLVEMTSGCKEQKVKEYSGAHFVQYIWFLQ